MKKLFSALLITIIPFLGFSQTSGFSTGAEWCSYKKSHGKRQPSLPLKSINYIGHSFDVLNYKLNLDLYKCYFPPFPHDYSAQLIIRIKADSIINSIQLNAVQSSLLINSIDNPGFTFSHNNDLLTILLDRYYSPGEVLEISINYRHYDVEDGGFYAKDGFVFTDAEPQGARLWFPCWDQPSDKATLDLTAKVPADVLLGSNGRLADSVKTADTVYYQWISRDPIATYLITMTSKKGYHLSIRNWRNHQDGTLTPIRYYFNDGEHCQHVQNAIDTVAGIFQQVFCTHPFEKNGFATLNDEFTWGGMENQTLASLCNNCWDIRIAIHEFAHQWFGDMITCATWSDLWLNEGFATYLEAFVDGWFYGYDVYFSGIKTNAKKYLEHNPGWAIAPDSWEIRVPENDTLFNYYITYLKGSCILHMLRYTIGDSLFMATLHSYANDTNFRFKSVRIGDFTVKVNAITGRNMNWFFDEWLKYPDHPVYDNTYYINDWGNDTWNVDFNFSQVQSNAPFFAMPVELKFRFTDNSDTLIRVMNSQNNQTFSWQFRKQPTEVIFDPDTNIVLKESSTVWGIDDNPANQSAVLSVFPNPAFGPVEVQLHLAAESDVYLSVYDISGKEIKVLNNANLSRGKHTIWLCTERLTDGIYLVKMRTGHTSKTIKLLITG